MFRAKIAWTALLACCFIGSQASLEKTKEDLLLSDTLENDQFYVDRLPPYEDTVQFYLYTKKTPHQPQQLLLNNTMTFTDSNIDTTNKTLILIHGYNSDAADAMEGAIRDVSVVFTHANVIEVDWSYFTKDINYAVVVSRVKGVGDYVGQFVEWLISQGVKATDLHLIGHSLGAHVAGFAGKRLKADNRTVARITGLDPAFPGFYSTITDPNGRLDMDDADFVDCIHTCGGKLGYPTPICQADFFPNGGLDVQPGCSLFDVGSCSHRRSYLYFAESIIPNHFFNAQSCKGIAIWAPYDCHDKGALMGYPASPEFKGPLILKTKSQSPFALNVTRPRFHHKN